LLIKSQLLYQLSYGLFVLRSNPQQLYGARGRRSTRGYDEACTPRDAYNLAGMPLVHDRCICLRKVEYSETSQILTLFGREHGRVQLIAKGAHRRTKAGASKFDGGVDLLDLGEAVFSLAPERDLCPLTEWHQIDGHLELRRSLRSMYLGLYAAELVNLLIEDHDPHPSLFERMEQALAALGTPRIEERFLAFELDLLREAGYLPEFAACISCGTASDDSRRVYFSSDRGGVVCDSCEATIHDRLEIDPRLLRIARGFLLPRQRLPRLTRHQTNPINAMLARHLEHTLSRRLRMVPYVLDGRTFGPAPKRATGAPSLVR
jgi:DNA repair protein RecO (recombination protein O)